MQQIKEFVLKNSEDTIELLKTLAAIPAPSCREEKRAEFVKNWLQEQGAKGVHIDDAGNVVYLHGRLDTNDLTVMMAHMDVVFPDMEPFEVSEKKGRLYAPGIGDDTANLVNLMMAVKFLLENPDISGKSILFVANSGEEGLGNLKGSREIWRNYGDRIKQWISLDIYMNGVCDGAVGSQRYRVTVRTRGGHSYGDFGEENAIAQIAELINDLYHQQVPVDAKTTYNVGMIEGGTSVNTIAQSASICYEFRSESAVCLKKMEKSFEEILRGHSEKMIEVETLGIRPGKGKVDEKKQQSLVQHCYEMMKRHYSGKITVGAASTDSNIPLFQGIPAVTVGTVMGGLLHTREEWIEKNSMNEGQMLAIELALFCMEMKIGGMEDAAV